MAYFENTYRFLLEGVEASVIVGNEFRVEETKDGDSFYFRRKLATQIKFYGADYTAISSASTTTRFSLVLQMQSEGVWSDYVSTYFYKNDCEINEDDQLITVKPLSDDGSEDIKKVLNSEYNFVDLNPATTAVKYRLKPILQIVSVEVNGTARTGGNLLTNIAGLSFWTEDLDEEYTIDDLFDYGFSGITEGDITLNGVYHYARYLTSLDTFNSVATEDRRADDISRTALFFSKTSAEYIKATTTDQIGNLVNLGTQEDATKYGKAPNCGAGDRYYVDGGPTAIPVNQATAWGSTAGILSGCDSVFLSKPISLSNYEITNSELVEIPDAYSLAEVIQKLLEQETDIVFDSTSDYSEFFYSGSDPIAGKDINLFFTPKSNLVNAFYTNPARKSRIRLSELLDLLYGLYSVKWHTAVVDGEKRLRLEHIKWYENGGTYGDQQVSIDLSSTYDGYNRLPLDYNQNKYSYSKSKMVERYEFAFDDDTTPIYNGYPIEVVTGDMPEGTIERNEMKSYTPEFDNIIGREAVSLDGWSVMDASLVGGVYEVNLQTVEVVATANYPTLNGSLSFINLLPKYQRYGKSAEQIVINEESTTALSVTRNRTQDVRFTVEGYDINPLNLIKTSIGSGQVEKLTLNLVSSTYEITLNHDTE